MKKIFLVMLSLIAVVGIVLFMTGCSDSNGNDNGNGNGTTSFSDIFGPDGPEGLDSENWDIYFGVMDDDERYGSHEVVILIVDPMLITENLTLTANGDEINLENWGLMWYGEADFVHGQSYDFVITMPDKNYSVTLQIPYSISQINFPEEFDPTQSYQVSWTLESNNKNQFAELWSTNWEDSYDDDDLIYSEYLKELSPSDRQHTFPANAVQSFGPGTEYDMGIIQADYKLGNRLAAVAASPTYTWYDEYYRTIRADRDIKERVIRIIEHLK